MNHPLELRDELVLGEVMPVVAGRAMSLREVLDASRSYGDQEYLVFGERRLTFAEHHAAVAGFARRLAAEFDIGPGDRVAVYAANSPEWIIAYWATVGSGAVLAAANSWWLNDEIAHALEESTPSLLIVDAARAARLDGVPIDCPLMVIEDHPELFAPIDGVTELPDVEIAEDDPADILFTSGTTGRAKGALHSHRNTIALIDSIRLRMLAQAPTATLATSTSDPSCDERPTTPPTSLCTSPLFHLTGLHAGAIMGLASGRRVVWTTGRFDPAEVLHLIEAERCTSWAASGTPVWRVVTHPDVDRHDLASMQSVAVGAGAISPELLAGIRRAFPLAQAATGNAYGLTESTGVGTKTIDPDAASSCVGVPSAIIGLSIRSIDGGVVPDGVVGEICLRGPSVMLGYWDRPAETEESFYPGRWLRTGDIGWMEDGQLHLAARRSDLIVRGGENIYPAEVEQCLERHDAVAEAAVVGTPDVEMGQRSRALVVLRSDQAVTAEELKAWAGARLARFKVPDEWHLRREPFPRTATGKVVRAGLGGKVGT